MKFNAIIFDLDGTLLNTLSDIVDSLNEVLKKHGFNTHTFDEYKYLVGNGAKTLINRAVPQGTSDFEMESILNEYLSIYKKHQYDKTCSYDGIPELLLKLNEINVKISVLSNKPHSATVQIIDHYFKSIKFNCVFGERPNIPIKPDKTSALLIAKDLNIHPSEILFVGDSDVDMKTAIAAAMFPVGALWGFRTKDELIKCGAKKLVEHPRDIVDIIYG